MRAKRYGILPSQLMGIEHPVAAHLFDEAVGWYGMWVEARLSERDDAGKPKYELDALLGTRRYYKYGE